MGKTNSELEQIFNSYQYQVKNMLSIVSSIYIVWSMDNRKTFYLSMFEVCADESNMRARNL